MIIQESCKKILSDVEKLESFDVVEEMVSRLEEHRVRVAELSQSLRTSVEKIKTLGETHCTLPSVGTGSQELRRYTEAIENNDHELRENYVVVKNSIAGLVSRAQENLEAGYQSLVKSLPMLDSIEPHLKLIETMLGHSDYVNDVRNGFDQIKSFGNVKNLSSDALRTYMKLGAQLQDLVDNIPVKEFTENVRKFLMATRKPEGAPYNLLTTDVEDWLKARNMITRIRIKLSS